MCKCGLVILLFLVIFAILFGGEGRVDTAARLLPPSGDELFGTDTLGRSLLERTAGGVGISLAAATAATVFSVVLGIMLSYLYTLPHFPKEVVLAVSDSMKSVPSIILALFLASVSGPGLMKLALAISVSHISDVSRTAYSRTSVLMKEGYIEAERSMGAGSLRIFFFHLLPHVIPYLAFQGVSVFLSAVIAESTLSYLGCGVQVPMPSLGSILSEARPVMLTAPWMIVFPASFLLLLGLSLSMIAISLSEPDSSSERSHKRKLVRISKITSDRKS